MKKSFVDLLARKDEECASLRLRLATAVELEAQAKVKDERQASSEREAALLRTMLASRDKQVSDLRPQVSDLRQQVDELRLAQLRQAGAVSSPSPTPAPAERPLSARTLCPASATSARRIFPSQAHQPTIRLAQFQPKK